MYICPHINVYVYTYNNSHPTPNSSIHFTPMMEYGGFIATGQGNNTKIFSLCHEDICLSLEIVKKISGIITTHSSKYVKNIQSFPNTNEKKLKNLNLSFLLMGRLSLIFTNVINGYCFIINACCHGSSMEKKDEQIFEDIFGQILSLIEVIICLFILICMFYIYIFIRIYIFMYMYMYIYKYTFVCTYIYVYLYLHICTFINTYKYIYIIRLEP
jgi:hypothetical protein